MAPTKVVLAYAASTRIKVPGLGVHNLRVRAEIDALEHEADIIEIQDGPITQISPLREFTIGATPQQPGCDSKRGSR